MIDNLYLEVRAALETGPKSPTELQKECNIGKTDLMNKLRKGIDNKELSKTEFPRTLYTRIGWITNTAKPSDAALRRAVMVAVTKEEYSLSLIAKSLLINLNKSDPDSVRSMLDSLLRELYGEDSIPVREDDEVEWTEPIKIAPFQVPVDNEPWRKEAIERINNGENLYGNMGKSLNPYTCSRREFEDSIKERPKWKSTWTEADDERIRKFKEETKLAYDKDDPFNPENED